MLRPLLLTLFVMLAGGCKPNATGGNWDGPAPVGRWRVIDVQTWDEDPATGAQMAPNEVIAAVMSQLVGTLVYEYGADGSFRSYRAGQDTLRGQWTVQQDSLLVLTGPDAGPDPEAANGQTIRRVLRRHHPDTLGIEYRSDFAARPQSRMVNLYWLVRVPAQ